MWLEVGFRDDGRHDAGALHDKFLTHTIMYR